MVTEQASEHNLSDLSGSRSIVSTERLLNLLELSNSDLTASTGMEDLPISEMLLDTLLGVLQSENPELLAHSQRVAFLCYGMGRQFGWAAKRTNTLVTAALLHELGMLANPQPGSFWNVTDSEQELARYVTIDLLESCHADSDVLEILALSLQFRYRELHPEQSEYPTPGHVLLGAAAFQFAHLFEQVRHQSGGVHQLSEIVAALQTVAETPVEQQAVAALEEWLTGRDKIIHSFDPAMLFPDNQNLDEETAAFVRGTFVEILEELYKLQKNYDAFFILDSTGRFQLWNSGCQLHHGYTIREMRNKHWHNSLIGYCNHEGLAFSDAQTPLFQTLESGRPARTTLFLKQGEHHFVEADVDSIPIMGRDKLMLGIVELHRINGAQEQSTQEILYTSEWISELAGELRRLAQEDPEAQSVPHLDDELISIIESRLGIAPQIREDTASVAETRVDEAEEGPSSSIDLDESESPVESAVELDPADSDILTEAEIARADAPEPEVLALTESDTTLGSVDSDTVASDEPEHEVSLESDTSLQDPEETEELADTVHEFVLEEECDAVDDGLPELGSHLDNLLSRFDDIVSDAGEESLDVDEVAETEVETTEPERIEFAAADEERPEVSEAGSDVETSVEFRESAEVAPEQPTAAEDEELTPDQSDETAAVEEAPDGDFDEDAALAALEERPEEITEQLPEEPEEIAAHSEERTSGDDRAVDQKVEYEPVENSESGNVLDDELDFELAPNVKVTDSELLQALQDEEIAADADATEAVTASVKDSVIETTAAEQVEEVHEKPVVDQAEVVHEEPIAEPLEGEHEEPAAQQADEARGEAVAEVAEEPQLEPAVEAAEEVREEAEAEQAEAIREEQVAEEAEAGREELVASESAPEPTAELIEAEQTQTEELEPVAVGSRGQEIDQDSPDDSDDGDTQASPVSRAEWDAFVSYLLDPKSADRESVAILFLDLDRFKAINEGFGRQIGDDLLKEIARRLSEACGKRELSCRYGGGQFAVSCPGLTLEKASKRGDQIRKLIERTRFDVLPFQALTVSIGIASSEEGDTLDELMNRAEHSLYNAKRSGRNCVVALSAEQIQAELAEEEVITEVAGDKPFEVVSDFEAMIASDMIVYKLGGFLYDMHAKLLHVDKRHVSMRVGSKGFLPYWGRQDDARPVLIDLELGEGWGDQKDGRKPTKSSVIHIRIRPDGWVRNQETFLKRAQHVLRELKGYFAGS